jgi:Cu(I)/Ag(I) efflux system protein CusF
LNSSFVLENIVKRAIFAVITAAHAFAPRRTGKRTQLTHFKFEGIIAMKKNTFVVSVMTVAALLGVGSMFHAQSADASPRTSMMMVDASMDMKNMDMKNMKMDAMSSTHRGTGTIKKIDAIKGMVTLAHGPIASLKWPAMTMSFKLKDAALAKGVKAGDVVDFELVQSGETYVITRIQPSGK